jgi:hypothetical protein
MSIAFSRPESLDRDFDFRTGFYIESGETTEGYSCGWGQTQVDSEGTTCVGHFIDQDFTQVMEKFKEEAF